MSLTSGTGLVVAGLVVVFVTVAVLACMQIYINHETSSDDEEEQSKASNEGDDD